MTSPLPESRDDIALETPDGVILRGTDAWISLQSLHPALKSWAWLAQKLGMDDTRAASLVQNAAQRLRGFCRKCRQRANGVKTGLRTP